APTDFAGLRLQLCSWRRDVQRQRIAHSDVERRIARRNGLAHAGGDSPSRRVWYLKSEVGSRKSEVGSRKSEVGSTKSEVQSQKSKVRRPRRLASITAASCAVIVALT